MRRSSADKRQATTASIPLESVGVAVPVPVLSAGLDGLISGWNDAAQTMLGWTAAQAIGRPMSQVLGRDLLTGRTDTSQRARLPLACADGTTQEADVLALSSGSWEDGSIRTVAVVLPDANEPVLYAPASETPIMPWADVGDRIQEVGGAPVCAIVEVLRLREVNVGYSRSVGDLVIATIAERLRSCVDEPGFATRVDGERFAVVVPEDRWTPAHEQRLLDAVRAPITSDLGEVRMAGAIGVAFGPAAQAPTLLDRAEVSLRSAAETGANSIVWMATGTRHDDRQAARISSALLSSIANHEIRPEFQPIVDLANGDVVMIAAIVQWDSGLLGLVDTPQLRSVAEASGLIHELGLQVLDAALDAIVAARRQSPTCRSVSVKVSPRQLAHPAYVGRVLRALAVRGLPGEALHIEITDRTAVADTQLTAAAITELRGQGVLASLDHFGADRSNLTQLIDYPIDGLKPDLLFVRGLRPASPEECVLRSILQLGKELDLDVIAPGVETVEQHVHLRRLGCRYGQGDLYAKRQPGLHAIDPVSRVAWETDRSVPARYDPARLAAVADARSPDEASEVIYNEVATRARIAYDVPIAVVVLVDDQQAWCAAAVGLDPSEVVPSSALWPITVDAAGTTRIGDTQTVAMLVNDPMTVGPFGIRSFLAVPLTTQDGHTIGALCVAHRAIDALSGSSSRELWGLASVVTRHLDVVRGEGELRRLRRENTVLRDQLDAERAHARRLLDSAAEGLILVDDRLRLINGNATAATCLGIGAGRADGSGTALAEHVHADDRAALQRWFFDTGTDARRHPLVVHVLDGGEVRITRRDSATTSTVLALERAGA